MEAAVDKKKLNRIRLGGRFADQYFARLFREWEGEYVRDVVFVFVLACHRKHLGRI